MQPPHKYQDDAREFCKKVKRAYLAIDMGLGKTRITLDLLAEVKRPALVFAPKNGVYNTWPEECEKWTSHLEYQILHGPDKNDHLSQKADLYFINPEGVKWLFGALQKYYQKHKCIPFSELIIDEGSMWKSHSTKRFEILQMMLPLFKNYRIILSGTPAPNSLLDLWSQYYLLDDGKTLGTAYSPFRKKFYYVTDKADFFAQKAMGLVDTQFTPHAMYVGKPNARDKIYKLIESTTYRLDSVDYLELPERIDNKINLTLPPALYKQYKKFEKDFFIKLEKGEVKVNNAVAMSNKLRQFIQGGLYLENDPKIKPRPWQPIHKLKLDALKEIVETSSGQSILCAIQFKFELEMIRKAFPDVPIIAGGTKDADANNYIRDWNRGNIPLLLCHPLSLSYSLNLQSGGHILLWFGMTWSLQQFLQLNRRLLRQGQEHDHVIFHYLTIKHTVDEAVFTSLTAKDNNQRHLLDYLNDYREMNYEHDNSTSKRNQNKSDDYYPT